MERQHIDGATRLIALLGWPVAHSVSPQLHNHVLARLGLPLAYVPLGVKPDSLQSAVLALRACGFAGANVTIPHKRQVVHYCDVLSELSARTGTVNTLYFRDGLMHGTTTDPQGFLRAVSWMGHDVSGGHVVILGNGGTARTLGFALALRRLPATLTLVGRNRERVSGLAAEIASTTGFAVGHALFDAPELEAVMRSCTLCVNCTNVGMHPHTGVSVLPAKHFHADMAVLDTIYNPSRTLFLQQAEQAGCTVQNGLRMLVYQGLASLALWVGHEIDEALVDMEELQGQVAR
ncbi:MAG: quinate/shikimate dehydrogenase [Chitinivibrionales bacterium]|nr:quinate/shikimate dehydrogenase [Chitinivibrionales bacterium]